MNGSFMTVAPLLRGLTFDGQRGSIVVFEDDPREVGFALDAEHRNLILSGPLSSADSALDGSFPLFVDPRRDGESDDELAQRVIDAYRAHHEEHRRPPAIVVLGAEGVFALGARFDDALGTLAAYVELLRAYAGGSISGAGPSSEANAAHRSRAEGAADAPARAAERADAPPRAAEGAEAVLAASRALVVDGKVSVVTGGAQGFGEEIVRHLTAAGSLVFIADLNERGASALAQKLNEEQRRTVAIPVGVDISREESVASMVEQIVRTAGGIDLLVSNAGVLKAGSVKEQPASEFEFVTRVNYIGFFLCTKWASRVMAWQNRPSGAYFTDIVQINSKSGLEGSNRNGAYAGSKFGGIGLTQSFALELVADNIKVNAICPGNFFDGPLWSDPERGLFVQYLRAGKVPGAQSIADVKRFYEEKVPMKRGCTGPDVVRALLYIVEQKYETGQAVPVTGGQVMLS